MSYDPTTAEYLSFSDARRSFASGTDTPRAYLERCLERIAELEPKVQAFVIVDIKGAQAAADAATARWKAGRPLSNVDGMPVGIKDCFDVRDFVTASTVALFADNWRARRRARRCVASRRCGDRRQDGHDRAHDGAAWADLESMGSRTHTRRVFFGLRGGGGRLDAADRNRQPGSRLRASSRLDLRRHRHEADVRRDQPLRRHRSVAKLNHLGFLGGTLTDVWETAHHIASVAGGDPGYQPLAGRERLPAPRKPARVGVQYTAGWPQTDECRKDAVRASFCASCAARGIEIVEPDADRGIRSLRSRDGARRPSSSSTSCFGSCAGRCGSGARCDPDEAERADARLYRTCRDR